MCETVFETAGLGGKQMADTPTFEEDVKTKVTSYLDGESVSSGLLSMLTDLAIEEYKRIRNYPSTFEPEQIEEDMRKAINTIAYGVVELIGKDGVEGNTSFSENGISRAFNRRYVISAYMNVVPIAHVRSFRN